MLLLLVVVEELCVFAYPVYVSCAWLERLLSLLELMMMTIDEVL